MTELDDHLATLLADDDVPATDPAFVYEVTQRVERRKLATDILAQVPSTIAGAVLLWAAKAFVGGAVTINPGMPAGLVVLAITIALVTFVGREGKNFLGNT